MEKCKLCEKCREICQVKAIVVISETVLSFHEFYHSCDGCRFYLVSYRTDAVRPV